jgi:hypothetical protein
MIRAAALLVSMAMLAVGCGDDDPKGFGMDVPDAQAGVDATPDAPARQVIEETRGLEPGESAEGIMSGGGSDADRALILLSAAEPHIGWNIHTHPNGTTVEAVTQYDKKEVAYIFDPPEEADWFLLVRNDNGIAMNITIRIELHGDLQWEWE